VARRSALPLRLLEVGSGAGLNLCFERYRYELGGRRWGPADDLTELRLRFGGDERVLARAGYHGDLVEWSA
jgi:hypothetical protein